MIEYTLYLERDLCEKKSWNLEEMRLYVKQKTMLKKIAKNFQNPTELERVWVCDCCLATIQQCFSYMIERTS
jgi:hypothetical protein